MSYESCLVNDDESEKGHVSTVDFFLYQILMPIFERGVFGRGGNNQQSLFSFYILHIMNIAI